METTITAWLVRLGVGDTTDIKGTLSLDDRDLRFADDDGNEAWIPLGAIRRVDRARLSPVIVVTHEGEAGPVQTAFYFAQPPPLEPANAGRMSLKRAKRRNTSYLSHQNVDRKVDVKEWTARIRAAAERAAGTC